VLPILADARRKERKKRARPKGERRLCSRSQPRANRFRLSAEYSPTRICAINIMSITLTKRSYRYSTALRCAQVSRALCVEGSESAGRVTDGDALCHGADVERS
jgi:hypothetical protein